MQGRGRSGSITGRRRCPPLLVLLAGCVGAGQAIAAPERDLARWLVGLTVRLPDHSTDVLGSKIDLRGLTCSGFKATSLDTLELEPSGTARTVVLWVRDALVERCLGTWTFTPLVGPQMQGNFSWSITDVNLHLPLVLDASEKREPLYVRSEGCQTAFRVGELSFDGSMSLPLKVFSDLLTDMLEVLVDHLGCRVPSLLLANLNGHLVEWLRSPKQPLGPAPDNVPPGVSEERLVDWHADVPLLQGLPDPQMEAHAMQLFVHKLTHGTDTFEGRSPVQLTLPANQTAQLGLRATVNVTGFAIAGLGSVSECQMLAPVPAEAYSLHSNCSLDLLNITASMTLELTPVEENSLPKIITSNGLVLHTSLSMALKGIHVAVQALLAADRTKADKLTIGGLMHQPPMAALATLAALFYAVNMTLLDAVIDEIVGVSVSQDGGQLGLELAGAINSFASTFFDAPGFQLVLPNAFREEVYPRARGMMNARLSQIQEMWPSADPDGGGLYLHQTQGLDPARDRWVFVCSICVFFPVCVAAYHALVRRWKRPKAPAEALQTSSSAQPFCSGEGPGPCSLADTCSGFMRRALPLLALSINTAGVIAGLTPACDIRVKAFGGLLDAGKPTLDESVTVYSSFQMVCDFWDAGAALASIMLVVGGVLVPLLGSLSALFVFAAPLSSKLQARCCLTLTVILRALFVTQCFIGLIACVLRAKAVIPGAEIDAVAEPKVAIPVSTYGSFSGMLLGSLLLYLHKEHTAVNRSARTVHGECPRKVAILALVGSVVGALSLCMAFSMEILSFEIGGLAGISESLPISRLPVKRDFWALDLPRSIINSTDERGTAFFVGIVYFVVMVVAPMVCFASWILQWSWVVASKQHPHFSKGFPVRWATRFSPFLYSWCALDVLAVAVFIGYLELDRPLQLLVKQKAATLCQLVQEDLGQPCVRVEGQLHAGFGFLVVSAVLSLALFLVSYRYLGLGRPGESDTSLAVS